MNYFLTIYIVLYVKMCKQSLWVNYGMILTDFEIKWKMTNPEEK